MALNIKYGVSTWLWTSPFTTQSINELFPKISKMGFDVVEIAVEDPTVIDIKKVKSALNDHGLKASICGAFGSSRDLTNESKQIQQTGLAYIESCLDICVELGVNFFGGPMYSAVGKAACIMLDSFHMSIEERDVEKAIVLAGEKLIHLQVSENYRGTPGTGQTPWNAYRSGLEAIDYKGIVTIESFTTDNVELAGAVCFWTSKAASQDAFATDGLRFLKKWATEKIHTATVNLKSTI